MDYRKAFLEASEGLLNNCIWKLLYDNLMVISTPDERKRGLTIQKDKSKELVEMITRELDRIGSTEDGQSKLRTILAMAARL